MSSEDQQSDVDSESNDANNAEGADGSNLDTKTNDSKAASREDITKIVV